EHGDRGPVGQRQGRVAGRRGRWRDRWRPGELGDAGDHLAPAWNVPFAGPAAQRLAMDLVERQRPRRAVERQLHHPAGLPRPPPPPRPPPLLFSPPGRTTPRPPLGPPAGFLHSPPKSRGGGEAGRRPRLNTRARAGPPCPSRPRPASNANRI